MANRRFDEFPYSSGLTNTDLFAIEKDPDVPGREMQKIPAFDILTYIKNMIGLSVYPTIVECRADIFNQVHGKVSIVLGEEDEEDARSKIYWFNSVSLVEDNGNSVLKPDSIIDVDPGRHLKLTL